MNKTPIQVLLVEDSPSDANLFSHIFSRANKGDWELVWMERLSDAISACSDLLFDVVLLDLSLPDSNGMDTINGFRSAAPDIPIVVLTGSDDEDLAIACMAKGAQDYLVKDQITIQLLMRAIRYAIGRGQILKQLQESERRFRGIFEQTFQLMMLLTPEGIVLEVNQNTIDISGKKTEDFIGMPLGEIEIWPDSPEIKFWLKNAIESAANGKLYRGEIEFFGWENKTIWIDFSLKPLTDENKKIVMLIAEGRDIRERKKAEAEILKSLEKERELNQLKSSFISMVSHEFRNPMSAIRTSAEILQYEPETLNLEVFCLDIMGNLEISNENKPRIVFNFRGECSEVVMDGSLLGHIINNLLTNALKYSPKESNIDFTVVCTRTNITIQIEDKGIGVPLKDQERLFETFYRGSNVSRIQGSGLGLAIVKKCVDLHHGQVQIESEVGVGTKVTVSLPMDTEENVELNKS